MPKCFGPFILKFCVGFIYLGGPESRRNCTWPRRGKDIQCGAAPEQPQSKFPMSGEQTGRALPSRCHIVCKLLNTYCNSFCSTLSRFTIEYKVKFLSSSQCSGGQRNPHSTKVGDAQLYSPKAPGPYHLSNRGGCEQCEWQRGTAADVVHSHQNHTGPREECQGMSSC